MAARSAVTRALLVVSAASGAAAVGLASGFGAGEFVHREWISLGAMLRVHGVLMALGFTLCGLAGHLRLQPGERAGGSPPACPRGIDGGRANDS